MRPADLGRQFEYLIATRARFLEKFRQVGWEEFTKDRGASWGSMLGIFLHMLDDEEGWWQIATRGGSLSETPDRQSSAYRSFDAVAEDNLRVGEQTRARLSELSEQDLARAVTFRAPEELTRTFETLVMHAWVDELAHVGELTCLLWQIDVKPPFLDWLDFGIG
jgi:uncharacterized damage-inducible protein DinB